MSLLAKGSYLVVEGNIGAGKTSLVQRLADDFSARMTLEAFSDNPFLPLFYKQPERYAFAVELFFMAERHKQLQEWLSGPDLFSEYSISDYLFFKTLLFAGKNLEGEELRLFQRLFHTLNASAPTPDLLVYLHRPVPDLLRQIAKRGRSYEADIKAEYLEAIQSAYFQFFKSAPKDYPIVVLDMEGRDFVHNEADYNWVLEQIAQPYEPGFHIISENSAV